MVYEGLAGSIASLLDVRLLLMLFMNSIPVPPSKAERLKFGFKILDQEENGMIPYEDLQLILQANFFAGSTKEIDPKARLLIRETANTKSPDDPIILEDFQILSKNFQGLFFP